MVTVAEVVAIHIWIHVASLVIVAAVLAINFCIFGYTWLVW